MITINKTYTTSDGTKFEDRVSAERHEAFNNIHKNISKYLRENVPADIITDRLLNYHKDDFLTFFNS
jgi:hypothetical protein